MSSGLKKFESQTDIQERNKKRQEEWERVRKPNDPVERPEEASHDGRSLYERLQEQKEKKQLDFEEQIKFKNQFRGIDEDEAEFLSIVSKRTSEIEKNKLKEENEEINAIKEAMETAIEPEVEPIKLTKKSEAPIQKNNTQQNILKAAIKRKRPEKSNEDIKKLKNDEDKTSTNVTTAITSQKNVYPSANKCVGILPGMGNYTNSDSDSSNTSEDEDYCLISRIIRNPQEED